MKSWKEIVEFVRDTYQIGGKVNLQPYTYRVPFVALGAGQQQNGILNANASSDFILTNPYYRASVNDAAPNVAPLVRVLLTDTGSSTQFSDQAVDLTTMFGRPDGAPFDIQYPRIVSGRSSLQVNVTNYSAALTYNLELSFAGVLVQAYN